MIFGRRQGFHRLRKLFPFILSGLCCNRPEHVDLELSNRCNLRCRMCWFHGENGLGDLYENDELTTSEVFNIVDQLAQYHSHIYIGGSEPFIREDFLMILNHIKSKDMSVAFTTNGTLLDSESIKMLVALRVDSISFSIDGNEELHDHKRGKGVFRKVTQSIRRLSEYKKKEAGIKPVITVNITITRNIMGRLKETLNAIRQATGDKADFYRLHHLWYVSQNELSIHQSAVRHKLGCSAPGAASHLLPASRISDPGALAKEIICLGDLPKVKMFPDLTHSDIVPYYSENPRFGRRCIAPFFGAVIKPNGDVRFCPDEWIDDYSLGNLRNNSFQDLWNNEKARRFRTVLLMEKHFAGCNRCSWMYAQG